MQEIVNFGYIKILLTRELHEFHVLRVSNVQEGYK